MTREEAVKEIEKAFEPAFANYIITALTEGATVSDKEQGTAYIQAIYTEALEEGIRCAMCTNTIKSDTGCDGGCIVDVKMYNKVMTEINSRLLRRPQATPQEPRWIPVTERLPEEEGFYLVTRRITADVATFIFRRTPTSKDYWKRCVTAWMPLPKPYIVGVDIEEVVKALTEVSE